MVDMVENGLSSEPLEFDAAEPELGLLDGLTWADPPPSHIGSHSNVLQPWDDSDSPGYDDREEDSLSGLRPPSDISMKMDESMMNFGSLNHIQAYNNISLWLMRAV
jgi:hypothetical protein